MKESAGSPSRATPIIVAYASREYGTCDVGEKKVESFLKSISNEDKKYRMTITYFAFKI